MSRDKHEDLDDLPCDLRHQFMIAKFSHRMEQLIYGSPMKAAAPPGGAERQGLVKLLEGDLDNLEAQIKQQQPSCEYRDHIPSFISSR